MGTAVQYNMYLPGRYSVRDLNDTTGNSGWPSQHENKTFGQYYGIFSSRPEHMGYDREQLRQTILRHETIFKHQLHELHRLHQRQMSMMTEVRSKEPYNHLNPMGPSQSRFCAFHSDDRKRRWQDLSLPLVDLNCRMEYAWSSDSILPHHKSTNIEIMKSSCGSTHNGSMFKDRESLESKCKKIQRRSFDLELPADEYLNNEDKLQETVGGSGMENYPRNRNFQVSCMENGNLFNQCGISLGDALSSNMLLKRRTLGFTDLNEPIQVEEASSTASVDILGDITGYKEEIGRWNLFDNSGSGLQYKGKGISDTSYKEKDEGVSLCNEHLESETRRKECLPCTFSPGQIMNNRSSFSGNFHCEYLPAVCELSQAECRKAHKHDQNKKEQWKKKIFGVEISERNHDASIMTSDTLLQSLKPHSHLANSRASSISWKDLPSNTALESNTKSGTLMHGPEVIRDRLHGNGYVGLFPSSGVELADKNSLGCVSHMESKKSQGCQSVGFGCLNVRSHSNSASEQVPQHASTNNLRASGWLVSAKYAEANVNEIPPKNYQNEVIPDSSLIFIDGSSKEGTTQGGGLSWLRTLSVGNAESANGWNGSHVNLNSWKNCCHQSNKAETMKVPSGAFIQDSSSVTNAHEVDNRRMGRGDCSSKRKILGVPIFEKHVSNDLHSAISAPKPDCFSSDVNGVNSTEVGLLHTDLNQDPMTSESGGMLSTRSLEVKKESVECSANLRNHIDLNVYVAEDEVHMAHFSPRTEFKIAVEIDLEAPVAVETEIAITSRDEFLESESGKTSMLVKDESRDFHESFLRVAAEALVAISSSGVHDFQENAACYELAASLCDSLQWFSERVSSYQAYIENDAIPVSVGKNSIHCEDTVLDEVDFFEYMTLNLTETEVEDCNYKPLVLDNTNNEISLPRRPRRGQARRGRQRKDFQRAVLPTIASLSRNDVTEDFQMIEGLVRATGGTWQSTLSRRNSPKSKGGRGRRRSVGSATSPTSTAVSPPLSQQTVCGDLGLEETRLAGWGKRTRRPPRQRYPIDHPFLVR